MVFTIAQQAQFFTAADRIGLSAGAFALLTEEGINTPDKLAIGTKDFWDNFFSEMQKPKLVQTQAAANIRFMQRLRAL